MCLISHGFNPRTPCGVRLALVLIRDIRLLVSIHALLAECDGRHFPQRNQVSGFNPRTPCGVRRKSLKRSASSYRFQSTHSLRSATDGYRGPWGYNPFQSTHSLRSATGLGAEELNLLTVSIHALLAECDGVNGRMRGHRSGFNPRTPCGVRLVFASIRLFVLQFQSTHSLRSATEAETAKSR